MGLKMILTKKPCICVCISSSTPDPAVGPVNSKYYNTIFDRRPHSQDMLWTIMDRIAEHAMDHQKEQLQSFFQAEGYAEVRRVARLRSDNREFRQELRPRNVRVRRCATGTLRGRYVTIKI